MKKKQNLWLMEDIGLLKMIKMMRFTIFIVLISLSQTFAISSYSQQTKLTLDMSNVKVEDVIDEIENNTEFFFLYNKSMIDVDRKVDIEVENEPVNLILEQVFKNTDISFSIKDRQILLINNRLANPKMDFNNQQNKTITGKITDLSGQLLPGVTILIKGTVQGTIADVDGNYSLTNVPADAILVFSFVGMKTKEIELAGKTLINVIMEEDAIGLEEVVAIGYGTQKKVSTTGSIATIDANALAEAPNANLSNSIAGLLPGVIVNTRSGEPGNDDADIYIRGKGTLGSTSPLVVIDGIPDRGGFSRLNSSDIESFTVLKDASAAIYGARAANGVILITTKRGKKGKPVFSFDNQVGLSQPTRLPDLLDSWQYATVENEYADNFSGATHKWAEEDIKTFKDGSSPLTNPNTDWVNILLKKWSLQSNHSMSVRGGTDAIRYFISGQYQYQSGNYKNDSDHSYDQFQWRANMDTKLTKSLSFGVDMLYRREKRDWIARGEDLWYEIRATYPYLVDYFPNGYSGQGLTAGNNLAQMVSPDAGYNKNIDDIFNTKFSIRWDLPIEGLTFLTYGAFDLHYFNQKQFMDVWDEYTYDGDNQSYNKISSSSLRKLGITKNNWSTKTFHSRLEYKKSFGQHNMDAFVAYEQSEYDFSYLYAYREGFVSSSVDQLFAGSEKNKTNDGNENATGRLNFFGRLNYDFASKYLASFTLRYDGSQNFPKGKRFGAFPGISVGWRMSEEPFLKDNFSFIDNLKLRASYGIMGNDDVVPYQYLSAYSYGNGYVFGNDLTSAKGFVENTTPNPNITWEKAKTANIALEGILSNGLLGFDVELFRSVRNDILITRDASIPDYTGLNLPDENLGEVLNRGVEIQLSHRNKINNNLSYNIQGNFSFSRNEVLYMDEAADTPDYQKREGYPIDSWVLYESDGLFQNQEEVDQYPHIVGTGPGDVKIVDKNGDKEINEKDQIRRKYGITPEIMYGFNCGVSYKNFNLSFLFQGQAHAYLLVRPTRLNFQKDYFEGRWLKAGDNEYPRTFTGATNSSGQSSYESTFWLKSAAFLRLKNAYLSYQLPHRWMDSLSLSGGKIFISGSNLFSIDNIKFFDPELDSNDGVSYSIQRSVQLGFNLSF